MQASSTAKRAQDFTNSLGVNIHLNYGDSGYANKGEVLKALEYLNIDEVRSIPPFDWSLPDFEPLLKAGVEFNFLYPDYSVNDLTATLDMIAKVDSLYPGSVSAIEGLNEANTWPGNFNGDKSIGAQVAFQKRMFDAIQAHPTLNDVPVYNLSLGGASPEFTRSLGNMSGSADYGNAHVYFGNASPPQDTLDYIDPWIWVNSPGQPRVITETGFITIPNNSAHVDETTQAKYTLDLLMDVTAAGIEKTYLYELLDQHNNPSGSNVEDHYGLFRYDYSPKPAATAIHNLNQILADNGANAGTFPVTGLPYTVSGLPDSGNTMQFAKSDGSHIVAVWAEPRIWDPAGRKAIAAPEASVQVSFNTAYDTVRVYDPLAQSSPIRTLNGVNSVTLGITDHPLLIEVLPGGGQPVTGGGSATPPPAAAAASVTVGSGSDALVLRLQQDAWQGSAQYVVKVDGNQVGGVQTASATRASGQSDTLTVRGDFATGAHRAEVVFLNDAYGGTAATDRNLYVNGGSYNDGALNFTAKSLLSNGAAAIDFTDAASTGAGITVGSGSDALVLRLQQDAWQGNAQFTVKVDGAQIGGVQTASATRASGGSDTLTVRGNFAPGVHRAEVAFVNDAYGGTASTDRNLYVGGGSYNDGAIPLVTKALLSNGPAFVDFTEAHPSGAATTVGSGSDALVLRLQQDAWQGSAQFTVKVDGNQVGGVQTASATRASGGFDTVTVLGNFAAGSHRAEVAFVNDAYGGTAATDRNLYVGGATYDGVALPGVESTLLSNSTKGFSFTDLG